MLKNLLAVFPDRVDGQQALADKKAEIIYAALDAHPATYKVSFTTRVVPTTIDILKVVPDKTVRSRMNICFRVLQVCSHLDV